MVTGNNEINLKKNLINNAETVFVNMSNYSLNFGQIKNFVSGNKFSNVFSMKFFFNNFSYKLNNKQIGYLCKFSADKLMKLLAMKPF